jgi:TonB family protein
MVTWQRWEGRVIDGRFPLRQYLGGSKHSAVYLTEINGSKAAIKLVAPDAAQFQAQATRWELASQLSHPHLVRIFDTGRWRADDGQDVLFAVMEYADENLAEILPTRRLTPVEAREMLLPTLDALSYLHTHGMVHGKIKPANIRAVGDELKLSGEGVRSIGDPKEPTESDDAYNSPESASGALSPNSDIWSLGMTLVEALTNRLPAWDRTADNDPRLPENVPQPFADIAKHCLSRDPDRRWSTTEIRTRLEREPIERKDAAKQKPSEVGKAQELSTPAPRKSVSSPEERETVVERPLAIGKRRGGLVAAAVVVALAVIVAGVLLFRHDSPSPQPAATTSVQPSAAPPTPPTQQAVAAAPRTSAAVSHGAVTHEVLPDVPRKARDTITGTVTVKVKVDVDASGAVSRAALVSSGGSQYFANQALQAARQWTFTPPTVDGKAVPSEWGLRFEFKRNSTRAVPQRTSPRS